MKMYILKKCSSFLFFILFSTVFLLPVVAQNTITVKGVVTDFEGEALIGVSVVQSGSSNGTATLSDGSFVLSVPQNARIRFSYVGYETVELPATAEMKVRMEISKEMLDEVVIIGYGSVKRKDVTTAVSTVSMKDLDERPIISAAQAIQGKAAGVSVI
ncbi:MAG: carboxypeptidase-like regulatory domain-containing protein, partial [Dysgonamonadaceae bacterium]|nr:carboxypeptidase-like regulatory domain-containing protein [Dysgonamonadaceae bacterium]